MLISVFTHPVTDGGVFQWVLDSKIETMELLEFYLTRLFNDVLHIIRVIDSFPFVQRENFRVTLVPKVTLTNQKTSYHFFLV